MIIIEQIKQKEYERLRQKDIIEKDRQMILRQIKEKAKKKKKKIRELNKVKQLKILYFQKYIKN